MSAIPKVSIYVCLRGKHGAPVSFSVTISRPDVPLRQRRDGPLLVQSGQDRHRSRTASAAWARLHFTQPQWACLKEVFTGVSSQTAVVLWGQTEINDRRDPINASAISELRRSRQRETFLSNAPFFFLWQSYYLISSCLQINKGSDTGSRSQIHQHILWVSITTMRGCIENRAIGLSLSPPYGTK